MVGKWRRKRGRGNRGGQQDNEGLEKASAKASDPALKIMAIHAILAVVTGGRGQAGKLLLKYIFLGFQKYYLTLFQAYSNLKSHFL